MICPKWLIQASALGAVGAAMMSVPYWAETYGEEWETEVQIKREAREIEERQIRTHLYELHEGPYCPVELQVDPAETLDEARRIIEAGYENAVDESSSTAPWE